MIKITNAKNFVLIPTKSDKAIIIRRGPAKQVGIYSWNLKNDEIKSYQWLKGRIYEYFSDISPDGKYFLYSANKKGKSYTVISKSPWLKAISLWRNVGGYGGGLLNNTSYMLYDGYESYNSFRSTELTGLHMESEAIKIGVYPSRLIRNNWTIKDKTNENITFSKTLGKNKVIEKIWHNWTQSTPSGTPSFWERHRLIFDDIIMAKDQWEWCDVYKNDLLWSENGCIYRARNTNNKQINTPKLVYDFNNEEWRELGAPY